MRLYHSASKWTGQVGTGGVADGTVTTIPLASATGLTDGDWYVWTIDRVDANGTKTPSKWEVGVGQLSGSNFINCTRGVEGTAQAHSAGAVVEIIFTSKHWEDLIDFLEVEHNADGTHKQITNLDNNVAITQKDTSGTARNIAKINSSNVLEIGDSNLSKIQLNNLFHTVLSATQTANVNSGNNTIVDITGASLSLEAGTWLIIGNFCSARVWTSAGTLPRISQARYIIRDGSNNVLAQVWDTIAQRDDSTPREIGKIVIAVSTFSTTTTVKLSGYINVIPDAVNFASGFRIDSGTSGVSYSTITAIKL